MSKTAQEIVASIAKSEALFRKSPGTFSGFIRKVTKTRIDFHWCNAAPGRPAEMTINLHGVVCSRTMHDGCRWFGYTLDPFGAGVGYSTGSEVARLMLEAYVSKPAT